MANDSAISYHPDPKVFDSSSSYEWVKPPKPKLLDGIPEWSVKKAEDARERIIENLIEHEWRVAFIRQQIERLGVKPKGRSRADLVRQLVETFLDPDRFTRQFNKLSDNERRFYITLLLYHFLESLQTRPTSMSTIFSFPSSRAALTARMLAQGLVIENEMGSIFVPYAVLTLVPPSAIPFPQEPEPEDFVPAPDSHILLLRMQQIISRVQEERYTLRSRMRWRLPKANYMNERLIWPPMPEDAKKLKANVHYQGKIELAPSESMLSEDTLAAWVEALDADVEMVEFIYHILLGNGVLLSGDPVKLNGPWAEQWLMELPGRQMLLAYQAYRNIPFWASWYRAWQKGEVTAHWNYQNYWAIVNVEHLLLSAAQSLRWAILDVLAYLPHETWLSLDQVATFLGRLFPHANSHAYQQSLSFQADGDWPGFLKRVCREIITGPLHWMGFADIAPDLENPRAFRLHHLQDAHWDRYREMPLDSSQTLGVEKIRFLEEREQLRLTPPAPAEFLAFVQRWTQPEGLDGNVLRYHLDVERLHAVFEEGETPESLAEAWEACAGFEVQPSIRAWWQRWWDRYGHVRLYPQQAALMTRDEFTMQELQVALPAFRDAILGLVTPQAALLESESVDDVIQGLERQGYMPKEA